MAKVNTRLLLCSALTVCCGIAHAEQRWKFIEETDDISGKDVRVVAVLGDDNKSALVVRAESGIKATLTITPAATIFPDKTDAATKQMAVQVTLRSTAMDEPKMGLWRMAWMDYDSASVSLSKNGVVKNIFGGDSVAVRLDATERRFKFQTRGDGCEGLQEAVDRVIEIAAE